MRRWNSVALVCGFAASAGAFLLPNGARAADMVYPVQPMPVVQEYASGWYLRGDIGWRTDTKIGDVVSGFPIPSDVKLDDVVTGGGGGGYKAQWFRADVTVDYSGKTRFSTNGLPAGAYDAKVDSWTVLGNVYLDLGTWSGVTPYVGAGAGVVNFRVSEYAPPAGVIASASQNKAAFAWAYMAGVAYAFAPRWLVDFSYRRVNFDDLQLNPHLANSVTLKDLSANEFRIGLRYTFD